MDVKVSSHSGIGPPQRIYQIRRTLEHSFWKGEAQLDKVMMLSLRFSNIPHNKQILNKWFLIVPITNLFATLARSITTNG